MYYTSMRRFTALTLAAVMAIPLFAWDAEARGRRRTRSWSCASCKVRVRGHYRRSSTGRTYYVKPYTRTRGTGN